MVDIIVKALLLFSPIAYGSGINLDKFDLRFFQVGVIALFVAALFDKPKRKIKDITVPIALLLGLVIMNSFIHTFQPLDTRTVEDLFFGILGIIIISNYLKDPKKCYPYIYAAVGINIAVLVAQHLGLTTLLTFPKGHHGSLTLHGGMFGNSSRLAMYMALTLPYFWSWSIALFGILVIAILLCGEHNVLFTLSIFLICKAKGKIKIPAILTTIGIFIFYWGHYSKSIPFRWNNVWSEKIALIIEKPLLGYGFGNYYLLYGTQSFNSYIPFVFGLGILGLAWIIYVIAMHRKDLTKSTEGLAVIAFLVLCLYEYVVKTPRLWFTIIFIISAFLIKKGGNNESNLSGPIAGIGNGI